MQPVDIGSNMIETFLDPTDSRWLKFLQRVPHDVYHLPAYAILASRYEGGQAVAFYASTGEEAILVPLLLRDAPKPSNHEGRFWDATSPYGFSSPLFTHPTRETVCLQLLESFTQAAGKRGLISLFLRMHPLLPQPMRVFSQFGKVIYHGQTVNIDLRPPLDDILNATNSNHQRSLRKLTKEGFHAVLDEWDYYQEFIHLYRETMRRVEASPFYLFEGTYFDDLRELLGKHLHLCSVLSPSGELTAASLFTVADGILEYHLGGSCQHYIKLAPSKMTFDFMRRWGHERGLSSFHLGGGLGGQDDSLFAFKAGFSSNHKPFHTFRLILDQAVYNDLCTEWQKRHGPVEASDQFFPLYRHEIDTKV